MGTLRRWWGKIKCWFGFHDPERPQLVKLPEVNGRRYVLERVLCTRCGHIVSLRPAGRLRQRKP